MNKKKKRFHKNMYPLLFVLCLLLFTTEHIHVQAETLFTPGKVTGLQVFIEEDGVEVTWDDNGADYYQVYYGTDSSQLSLNCTTYAHSTEIWNLSLGSIYYVTVVAVNGSPFGGVVQPGESSDILMFQYVPGAVENVSVSRWEGGVCLSYDEVNNAQGYDIYRSENADTGYEWIFDAGDTTECYDTSVKQGHTYYYVIYPYAVLADNSKIYGTPSQVVTANIPVDTITGVTASSQSYKSVKVTWDKSENVEGYYIYFSENENGEYQLATTITNNNTTKWTHQNLSSGQTYYYKVLGYVNVSGTIVTSDEATIVSAKPMLAKATIKATTTTPTKMQVSWSKVTGAQGYVVYYATEKGSFKKVKTISGNKNRTAKISKVKNGNCYRIKVVAYRMINGKRMLGEESVLWKYADYYGYAYESYYSKYIRIYGSETAKQYTTAKQASSHMKTIKVKVWDFASGMSGRKVTKTKYVTVNAAIAPTVKKIFEEIYKGKEKAPIHDVGGYSFRSGQHGQGLALDINVNYNAMFENGKPTVGSYWNPKKYAYSIPRYGDVEKAFEKYGFYRGIWGNRKDYMHFSYFGT